MAPLMASVELVSVFTLARMGAGADAESLGILAKVYCTGCTLLRDAIAWQDRVRAHFFGTTAAPRTRHLSCSSFGGALLPYVS